MAPSRPVVAKKSPRRTTQNSFPRIGQHDPRDIALSDVDTLCTQCDEPIDHLGLVLD
jgi:hypothetical protein